MVDIDSDVAIEEYHQIWQDLKQRGSSKVQTFHHPKDGKRIPVEVTFNYIQFGGKEYNCAFARDISERKQAQEELKKSMSELDERVKELNRQSSIFNSGLSGLGYWGLGIRVMGLGY